MKTRALPLHPALAPRGSPMRRVAARLLRGASALLAGLARELQAVPDVLPRGEPTLEFYAEAGAPEGALYVDGERVGVLEGVRRL